MLLSHSSPQLVKGPRKVPTTPKVSVICLLCRKVSHSGSSLSNLEVFQLHPMIYSILLCVLHSTVPCAPLLEPFFLLHLQRSHGRGTSSSIQSPLQALPGSCVFLAIKYLQCPASSQQGFLRKRKVISINRLPRVSTLGIFL